MKTALKCIGVLLIALGLVSCAQKSEPDYDNPGFYDQTLTITAVRDHHRLQEFARRYMLRYPGVYIEVTSFNYDFPRYIEQLFIGLMSGTADDFFDADIDYMNPATIRLLADWLPIMRADPDFSEDDYFMSVLNAMTFQGGLYEFPFLFQAPHLIVANSTIPGLTQMLADYATLSVTDLKSIREAVESDLYLHASFALHSAVTFYINSFLDIENRTADFNNPRFINLISNAVEVIDTNSRYIQLGNNWHFDFATEEILSGRYLFQEVNWSIFQYFLPYENEFIFEGITPVADADGRVLIGQHRSYALNAAASYKDLAWDFIKFMQDTERNGLVLGDELFMPVYRPFMRSQMHRAMPEWLSHYARQLGWRIEGDEADIIDGFIAQIEELHDMPMTYLRLPYVIHDILRETLQLFTDGLISAEEAAIDLQNKITLVLWEMG